MNQSKHADKIAALANTLRNVPLNYRIGDTEITDLTSETPIRLHVADSTNISNFGTEFFIAEFADGHFECDWVAFTISHPCSLHGAVEHLYWNYCQSPGAWA